VTTPSPPSLSEHRMVYDPDLARVLLFGGWTSYVKRNVTWAYHNDGTWAEVTGSTPPVGRLRHTMAYDTVRDETVVTGGWTDETTAADTWTLTGSTWADVTPPVEPEPRALHSMADHEALGAVVLFGGSRPGVGIFNDTWLFDGRQWLLVDSASSPPARHSTAMAYDAVRQRVVLFGGKGESSQLLDDTWEFDGASWREVVTPRAPLPRDDHAMAYDRMRQRVVLFGGYAGVSTQCHAGGPHCADTWEFDGVSWRETSPSPSPKETEEHSLVFDSVRHRIVLDAGYLNYRTWEYDGLRWVDVAPTSVASRRLFGAAFLPAARAVVAFGGWGGTGFVGGTWQYDGAEWVDTALLAEIADRRPDWSLVLVGKSNVDISGLAAKPNVHVLGQVPFETLPGYCRGFDVGLIPFVINELTERANPLKLREYLSAGLPVISTPLPEVRRYEGLVKLATTADEWVDAIELSLSETGPEHVARRVEAMKKESWKARVDEMCALIAGIGRTGISEASAPSPAGTR
jgi:hypothetical protein